jgi:hypothetical protein
MASKKSPEISQKFACIFCDYSTCKSRDYTKHMSTDKHKKRQNASEMLLNASEKSLEITKKFTCDCGKIYNHDSSYYRHKKGCNKKINKNKNNDEIIFNKDLIMIVLKQNQEILKENNDLKNMMMEQQNQMIEVIKNGTHNTTYTNSNNKAFNLNFFLNETCKDAMNIMEFVESIKFQLSDLEKVGELGYVEGISNIIVKNLKALDVTQRPVHCTDKKRETLYIKDEDKWEKDDEKKKMHTMVKKIAHKNARLLPKFKEEHPDCGKSSSKFSDQYNKIIVESMGGAGDNDFEKEEKIIKRVTKEVIVERDGI